MHNHKHILLHITSSLKMGGAEAVLYELINGLGNDEFEHYVIYFYGGPWEVKLRELGVQLYHVRGGICLYDPVFCARLYKTIKRINPESIHSLLWAANVSSRVVARMLSIPHVSVYHNNIDQDGKLRNWLDKLTRRFSRQLVAVSQEVAQSVVVTDRRLSLDNILVVRNGVNAADLLSIGEAQAVARDSLGLCAEHFVVGSVGRFCPVKNYPLLLESFMLLYEQFPYARLLLLGTGPDEQKLRDLAQHLGIAHVVTFVVGKQAHGYFHLFDCFVQSSNKEGVSMALLEAMVHAVPCVVTNTGDKHSVLKQEVDGLIVNAGDVQGLSLGLARLIKTQEYAMRLGQAGKGTVESRFAAHTMVAAYRELFISSCHFGGRQ